MNKKIFKLFKLLMLALIFAVAIFPAGETVAANPDDAYRALLEYLQDEIDSIGEPIKDDEFYYRFKERKYTYILSEISMAYFLDVTGDGIEELIIESVAKANERIKFEDTIGINSYSETEDFWRILSYKSGKVELIARGNLWLDSEKGQFEPDRYVDGNFTHYGVKTDDGYKNVYETVRVYCIGKNGKVTIANDEDVTESYSGEGTRIFYSYDGNSLKKEITFSVSFTHNWYVSSDLHSSYGRYSYYINGKDVTEDYYKSKLNEYTAGGVIVLKDNDYHEALNKICNALGVTANDYYTPSAWAAESVNGAIEIGYVDKNLRNKYTKPITRQEFCSLATRYYEKIRGKSIEGRVAFHDTSNSDVEKMASLGVINGVGGDYFEPNELLTREMAAAILSRLAEALESPMELGMASFSDADEISSWALEHVGKVQKAGIMNGTDGGKFEPNEYYTREQSIVTIARLQKLFVPAEKIQIKKTLEIVKGATYEALETNVYPKNATNQTARWTSSDESILKVDENTGRMEAVNAGKVVLTATAESGVSAQCTVTVSPIFINLKTPLNTELNVFKIYSAYSTDYEDIPEDDRVVGKIAVTNVTENDKEIKITVKLVKSFVDFDFDEYIKWRLVDEKGTVYVSDVSDVSVSEVGQESTIKLYGIERFENEPGKKYFLEFKNDEGEDFKLKNEKPIIKFRGLENGAKLGIGVFSNKKEDISIKNIKVDLGYYYFSGNKYSGPTFYVYSQTEPTGESDYVDVFLKWKLTDSKGNIIDSDSGAFGNFSELDESGNIETEINCYNVELKCGETYYFEVE